MPPAPTIVTVSGVPIGLAILEISKEVKMRYMGNDEFKRASPGTTVHGITWTEWQRVPTGRLKLVAYRSDRSTAAPARGGYYATTEAEATPRCCHAGNRGR
ncbi:hypothetical protein ATY76_14355 [Rhizobium sp. R339]|uniref:hypothetical protein n=1 Tax=Rhizobium sp. R339 TaxID=1764273 RepID=UPI000B530FBC|nr:hypothetical protein [Rhizobium sp. R339]OWV68084.1 hypothetical protein ATY76_14355 [Rhizobium sp. R339]